MVRMGGHRQAGRLDDLGSPGLLGDPDPELAVVEAGQHRLDRTGGHPPSTGDDRHVVTYLLDLGQDVAGDQHRDPGGGEAAHQVPHLPDAGRVQPVGRLVEDQQLGLFEEGGGHREPLFHAQRVRLHPLVGPVTEPDLRQHLVDPGRRHPTGHGEQPQRAPAGEVAEELGALHDGAEPAGHGRQPVRCRLPEQRHPAAVRPDQAEQRTQGGGLARPVGTEEAVYLARLDQHVEAVQSDPAAATEAGERLAQAVDLDHRWHGTTSGYVI